MKTHTKPISNTTILTWVAVAALVGIGLLWLAVVGVEAVRFATGTQHTSGRKPIPLEDFKQKVKGKTKDEVKAMYGPPDRSFPWGETVVWSYDRLIRNPDTGKADTASITFSKREDGPEMRVWYAD